MFKIEDLLSLLKDESIKVLKGVEAYEIPMILRIEERPRVIKQIINQDKVANFHQLTNNMVKEIISKRVEYGISIKNLITYSEKPREIEITNPQTLKESRMLAKEFEFNGMLALFNDYVTFTNLDPQNCFGFIMKNREAVKSFESIFEKLWTSSTKV